EALKEERAPTWHARVLGAERARRCDARFEVVSPAPTLDALVSTDGAIDAPDRVRRRGWPRIDVVDLREEPPGIGLLTRGLGAARERAVADGGRAVCVLNRRGRARLLACASCGELATCQRCGTALRVLAGALECPRGDAVPDAVCARCGHATFRNVRP